MVTFMVLESLVLIALLVYIKISFGITFKQIKKFLIEFKGKAVDYCKIYYILFNMYSYRVLSELMRRFKR